MEEVFAFLPIIGGISIAIIATVLDHKQKKSKAVQDSRMAQIISSDQMPLEEVVRSVLAIQMQHQEKDKWVERVIGFLMGLVSSLIVSLIFYYMG